MLTALTVHGVRNLADRRFPGRLVSMYFWSNGAGKTSVLESIIMLSYGRSFRASQVDQMIAHEMDSIRIRADIVVDGKPAPLGIEKLRGSRARIRFNHAAIKSFSGVADLLPSLLIDTDTHRQLLAKPDVRRRFLDWGVSRETSISRFVAPIPAGPKAEKWSH